MPIDWKGSPAAQLVRVETTRDPTAGDSTEFIYEGSKEAIAGIVPPVGAVSRTTQNGPVHTLSIVTRSLVDGSPEVAVDTWTITTEILQKDIFSHPKAMIDMYNNLPPGTPVSGYKKTIVEAVEKGELLPAAYQAMAFAPILYLEYSRGQEYYEVEYYVLKRTRVTSASSTYKLTLDTTQQIYNTSALPVPATVLFTLPDSTALNQNFPTLGAFWGWRLRNQQSEFIAGKVTQSHEWTLAAWSTGIYTVASSNFPP